MKINSKKSNSLQKETKSSKIPQGKQQKVKINYYMSDGKQTEDQLQKSQDSLDASLTLKKDQFIKINNLINTMPEGLRKDTNQKKKNENQTTIYLQKVSQSSDIDIEQIQKSSSIHEINTSLGSQKEISFEEQNQNRKVSIGSSASGEILKKKVKSGHQSNSFIEESIQNHRGSNQSSATGEILKKKTNSGHRSGSYEVSKDTDQFNQSMRETKANQFIKTRQDIENEKIEQEKQRKFQKLQKLIKIQSLIRMFITKCKFRKLQKRFQIAQQHNKAEQQVKQYESNCINDYFNDRNKVFIQQKYDVNFSKMETTMGDMKQNIFFSTAFDALAETGNLDIITKTHLKRPQTAPLVHDQKSFHRKYQNPEDSQPIFSHTQASQGDGVGIVSLFLKKNKNFPQIFSKNNFGTIEDFNQELVLEDKFQKIKQIIDQNTDLKQSASYSDTFEKESYDQSGSLKKMNEIKFPKHNNSNKSLKESIISEEDFLQYQQDSQSIIQDTLSVKESLQYEKEKMDSKISESIKGIDEDIQSNVSIIEEEDMGNMYKFSSQKKSRSSMEEDIQQSGSYSGYADEKFESISEQHSSKDKESPIKLKNIDKYDQFQESINEIKKMSPLNKKKSVRFGESSQEEGVESLEKYPKKWRDQADQLEQAQVRISPQIQQIINKYKPLKAIIQEEDLSITKEQMQIKKVQADIQMMLNNAQKVTEKFQQDSQDQVSQKGEYLYSKFQVEFNRIMQNNALGSKLNLLSDYAIFKDTGGEKQSQSSGNVNEVMTKLQMKQDIIQQVLTQVLENLNNIRTSNIDFSQIQQLRAGFDVKIESLLKKQEEILRKNFELQLNQRDEEIKSMLKIIIDNQSKQQVKYPQYPPDKKQNKLQDLLNQNMEKYSGYTMPQEENRQIQRQFQQTKKSEISKQKLIDDFFQDDAPYKKNYEGNIQNIKDYSEEDKSIQNEQSQLDISWQSQKIHVDQIPKQVQQYIDLKNQDQLVDFLSKILLEEIKNDLFPLRKETGTILSKEKSQEYIKEKQVYETKLVNKEKFDEKKLQNKEKFDKYDHKESIEINKEEKSKSLKSSFDEKQESNEDQIKSTEQGIINNTEYQEMSKALDYYQKIVMKQKNSIIIIKNVLKCLSDNENGKFPQFSGDILVKQKIFQETDIRNKQEQYLVHSFEQEIIKQQIQSILQAFQKKKDKEHQLIEFLEKRFKKNLVIAKDNILNKIKKIVPKDFYKDAEINAKNSIDQIYKYCSFNKVPIEDDPMNCIVDYEMERNFQKYKKEASGDLLDAVLENMATEFLNIQKKRKNIQN